MPALSVRKRTASLSAPFAPQLRVGDLLAAACVIVFALAVGWGSVFHLRYVIVVLALPIIPYLILHPQIPVVIGVSLAPFTTSLTGDSGAALSPSDIFLTLGMIQPTLMIIGRVGGARERFASLRPLAAAAGVYAAACIINLAEHPSSDVVIGIAQRAELVAFPLIAGSVVLDKDRLRLALRGFVLSATVLAGLFATHSGADTLYGVQKNPAGGFMASAIVVLITQRWGKRWVFTLGPILAAGLVLGASRGALVGLVLAIGVIFLVNPARRGLRTRVQIVLLVLGLGFAISSAPASIRTRLTHDSSSTDFAVKARQVYKQDARAVIAAHPVEGVGINNYLAGTGIYSVQDPHDVAYAETAMGGYPLSAALTFLLAGTAVCLLRRRASPLAIAALAIQVATVGHAFADVYWVRGTPLLGWVTSAAAISTAAEETEDAEAQAQPVARAYSRA